MDDSKTRKEITEEDLSRFTLNLIRRLLARKIPSRLIRRLLLFIKGYVRFDTKQISTNFEKDYEKIIKINNTMGIEEVVRKWDKIEARAEGRAEALTEAEKKQHTATKTAVRNMRNKNFDKTLIADILSLTERDIDAFFKEIDNES